jgi:hypothetical protein
VELPVLLRRVAVTQVDMLHMLEPTADLGDGLVAGAQGR